MVGNPGNGFKLFEVLDGAIRVEHHAIDGKFRQLPRGILKAHRMRHVELGERHRIPACPSGRGKTVDRCDVARPRDVEHAQTDAPVMTAAQRSAGKAWVKPKLVHSVENLLTRRLHDACLAVDNAGNRLSRNSREFRNVRHGGIATAPRDARTLCVCLLLLTPNPPVRQKPMHTMYHQILRTCSMPSAHGHARSPFTRQIATVSNLSIRCQNAYSTCMLTCS